VAGSVEADEADAHDVMELDRGAAWCALDDTRELADSVGDVSGWSCGTREKVLWSLWM
jgi:hypothetical protein